MKKTLTAVTVAGFALAVSSQAQDAAPKPLAVNARVDLPEILKKETVITLGEAAKEMQAAIGKERNATRRMDSYTRFQFSPALRPGLKEIFGTERPFPMERVPGGVTGQVNFVARLAPYTYKQDNGTDFTWTELVSKVSTSKAGRAVTYDLAWPSLAISRAGGSVTALDMGMVSKQLTGADNVPYGTATIKIGSVVVRETQEGGTDSKEILRFEQMEARSDVVRRGAMAEIQYGSSTRAIVFGDDRVERVSFAFRVTNIPARAVADLSKQMQALQEDKLQPQELHKKLTKTLQDFGKRAAIAGATLFIDDLSAAYHGNVASLKGSIGFGKVVDADFKSLTALFQKLVARFEVRVPVALVRDVARVFSIKAVDPAAPDAVSQVEKAADAVASVVVGKTVTSGYGVVEQDELRSVIEIKNSKLTVNGKAIDVAEQLKAMAGKAANAVPAPQQ